MGALWGDEINGTVYTKMFLERLWDTSKRIHVVLEHIAMMEVVGSNGIIG